MNLTDQKMKGQNAIMIPNCLNAQLMSIKICPQEVVVAPDSNELVIKIGDRNAGSNLSETEMKKYVYNLSKPLCNNDYEYGEFHQEISIVNSEIKVRAYVEWSIEDGIIIEELEPLDIILFRGYNIIETNYRNVDIEIIYPKNDEFNRNFLNTYIYNAHKKLNNSSSQDDIYFKDAFTKMGNELNEEIDNLKVKCITSKNNKFSLDSEGNLVVNSITANTNNTSISNSVICDLIYPVGSIYLSVNSVNPNTLFGGTWTQLKDRFLLGAGNTYSNGSVGGEATHKLTINEMPTHTHTQYFDQNVGNEWGIVGKVKTKYAYGGPDRFIGNAGGDQAHNNMPPYLVVYMWKRIS